jgi:putative flavoprotein involved in K+ transport
MTAEHVPVVVVGAGQAGLSASWHLKQAGIEHLVLERDTAAHEWRDARWDSFCLVTPNWQCRLPGHPYAGEDPDGFMVREQILDYFAGFLAALDPPLREGVAVTALRKRGHGPYELVTSAGTLTADDVIVATGGYQVPIVPRFAERLPATITQVHSKHYRNPEQLPPGEVLVVGSGQSGAQLAEDLHLAGRTVHLCLGDAPRVARTYRGRDVVAWLDDMGYYALTADQRPTPEGEKARANHYVTGRDGGRDIDLRAFARDGMRLYGRLEDLQDGRLLFRQDLRQALDSADEVSESIKDSIDKHISENGVDAPAEERYVPVWEPEVEPTSLALEGSGITSVVWAIGYRADYSWIDRPVFNGRGAPVHHRGITSDEGLCFLGLPWQWTWGSARFSGVSADAEHLVQHLVERRVPHRTRFVLDAALGY